jgi:hypothetical protein
MFRIFWMHYRTLRLAVEIVTTLGAAVLVSYFVLQAGR